MRNFIGDFQVPIKMSSRWGPIFALPLYSPSCSYFSLYVCVASPALLVYVEKHSYWVHPASPSLILI